MTKCNLFSNVGYWHRSTLHHALTTHSPRALTVSHSLTHSLAHHPPSSRLEVIEVGTGRIKWQSILSATKSSMLHHGPEHVENESTVLVDAGQLRLRGGVVEWTPAH